MIDESRSATLGQAAGPGTPPAPSPSHPHGPTATDASDDRLIGTLIGERYRILDCVGRGGMGSVYRAEHVLMKKVVAVKLLHRDLENADEIAMRFEREAQSASRLSHEGIVQVTDFGRAGDGSLFLVMEFLGGESLAHLILRTGPLGVARACGLVRQVLSALDHAHAQGVVHRDLKPDNIMLLRRDASLDGAERVKLLDFGIAKVTAPAAGDPNAHNPTLTRAGLVFGTPDYMSPEQATGGVVDARADLYACGVILFELLTGRRPFVAGSAVAVMSMHLTAEPPLASLAAPEAKIPGAFDRIVRRAMEKQPERRYGSAAEFMAALDDAMAVPASAAGTGPSTSILSMAGTGGQGKPARITLTLDVDNLRSQWVALARRTRALAARALAFAGALVARGWARVPPRWRTALALALLVSALGGVAWRVHARRAGSGPAPAAAPAARASDESGRPAAAEPPRATSEESKTAREPAKKKHRKKRLEDLFDF